MKKSEQLKTGLEALHRELAKTTDPKRRQALSWTIENNQRRLSGAIAHEADPNAITVEVK